jgi:hypothetical protein
VLSTSLHDNSQCRVIRMHGTLETNLLLVNMATVREAGDYTEVFLAAPLKGAMNALALPRHHTNVGKVSIFFRVVQSVAHYELVGNAEAYIVRMDGLFSARGFVE